jgi:hypothetical protein
VRAAASHTGFVSFADRLRGLSRISVYDEATSPWRDRWVVATYRTGTGDPAGTRPNYYRWRAGFSSPGPIGWLVNRVFCGGHWTVVVGSPSLLRARWTARHPTRAAADAHAAELVALISSGRWNPELEEMPPLSPPD